MPRRLALLLALIAAVAIGACQGAPAAPALTDPNEILTKSVEAMTKAKSAHFAATVTGTFKADLMGSGTESDISLTGTTLEGDLDIANKKVRATFAVPALLGLNGEVIQIGQTTFTKTSLTGTKYQKQTSSDLPVEEVTDPTEAVANLRKVLEQPGVAPVKVEDTTCGDNKSCYQVRIELTADELAALASEPPTVGGADLENANVTMTFGVEKDSLRMSRLVVNVTMGAQGSADLTLNLTKWDEAVTINEPPADQVAE